MKTNYAYSVLTAKSVDEEKRIIEGIATTPSPDRYQDVVEPLGMEFKLPLPLLNQHRSTEPIGHVIDAKVTKDGILVKCQIAAAGILPYVDTVWAQLKTRLVSGLSIGFRAMEESYNRDTGGFHFIKTEWMELSVVTVPANADCNITNVKSAGRLLAASGTESSVVRLGQPSTSPGVPGTHRDKPMTIKEQITKFENERAAKAARMSAIMTKAGDTGSTLDDAEQQEYDGLEAEVDKIDKHLVRLRKEEKRLTATATPIIPETVSTPEGASAARGGVVQVTSNLPKGARFARYLIALHQAQNNKTIAAEIAHKNCSDTPEVEMVLKAEVNPATTTGTTWAAPLMPAAQTLYGEFLELLRPATILGRLPGVRYVPFRVNVPAQTGGATFGWVGEKQAKPVSEQAFATVNLDENKVAGICVISKELMKFGFPNAEQIITNSMVRDCAQFIDSQLLDPAVHLSTGVNPASLTDQVVNKVASGLTAAAFRADFGVEMGVYIAANDDPREIVIVMSATVALAMSLIRNALGQKEFPDLTVNGGSVEGIPVIVSQAVGSRIVFIKASDILVADGGIEIDMSQEASLVMTSTPESSPQATQLVSLFQRNLVGIRVEKFITWKKGRSHTVQYISSAVYSG